MEIENMETENLEKLDKGTLVKVIFKDLEIPIKDDSTDKFIKFAKMVTDLEQVSKKINKIKAELEEYKGDDDNEPGANQPDDNDVDSKKEKDNKENSSKVSDPK